MRSINSRMLATLSISYGAYATDLAGMAKNAAVDSVKDKTVDTAVDSGANMAKDALKGSSKDSVADMAKDALPWTM